MNALQKLYEIKSRMINKNQNNSKTIDASEYFKFLEEIRTRPNRYIIPQEKINIKANNYEPFKDPSVIKSNKRFKLKLNSIYEEPPLPKINIEYLEVREKNRRSKEKYREMAERALSEENSKYQDKVFNQKPRVEEIESCRLYTINNRRNKEIKTSRTKDYESDYRKYYGNYHNLVLPNINRHKDMKTENEKIFTTEVNTDNNSLNDQYMENSEKMKDHKHDEYSHRKPGQSYG